MAARRTGDVCEAPKRSILPSQCARSDSFLVGVRLFNDARFHLLYPGSKTKLPELRTNS